MKKIIIGGLAALAATVGIGLAVPATASASARCPVNYEYDPAAGGCVPIFSTQINGCDTSVGAPVEATLKCFGDDWE